MSGIVNDQIPFFWIGQTPIVISKMKIRHPELIKVVLTTYKEKSALPVKRHFALAPARLYK
jgi:hypothetical protein